MEILPQTEKMLNKTSDLLWSLGGRFPVEELKKRSFSDVVDSILRNGGEIETRISTSLASKRYAEVCRTTGVEPREVLSDVF